MFLQQPYDEYAIKAFEKNAVDYLMKPFSRDRFAQAIDKVKSRLNTTKPQEHDIQKLAENFTTDTQLNRIVVKTPKAMAVISLMIFFTSKRKMIT